MYSLYLEYEVNKTRKDYVMILSKRYPKDKNKFKSWRYNQLKAVYINFLQRRDKNEQ